ncbi:MAG: hypothetical protein R3F62_21035 [Planctomycetota bacterium]
MHTLPRPSSLTRLGLSLGLAPLALGCLVVGCLSDSGHDGAPGTSGGQLAPVSSGAGVATLASGPDAIGGQGSGMGQDLGDYVLQNAYLRAVIDQPGTDPTSPGGAFPLVNLFAPSGGTLVDLEVPGLANDQFDQMTQGIYGLFTALTGTSAITSASADRSRDLVLDTAAGQFTTAVVNPGTATGTLTSTSSTLTDSTQNFASAGVRPGDALLVLTGTNAGRAYAVAGVVGTATLSLTVTANTALTSDTGVQYQVLRNRVRPGDVITFSSGANAGRSYRVAAVGPLPSADGGTGSSVTIAIFRPAGVDFTTEGSLVSGGAAAYSVTRRTSPLENVVVYDEVTLIDPTGTPATLRLRGGVLNQGTVPDGASVAATTSRLTVGGAALVVETDYRLFPDTPYLQVETRLMNPGGSAAALVGIADVVVTGGFSPPNLAPWTPLAGFRTRGFDTPLIVPYVGLRGRNTPEVSYAFADTQTGQMIHLADGQAVAVNLQLSTRTRLAANETTAWTRVVSVGAKNDVGSAASPLIELLSASPVRVNPASGATVPNMFQGAVPLRGAVLGAPPGTTVTALQISPGLVFDSGAPNGLTPGPGFYPSTLFGAQERLMNTTEPDPLSGQFVLSVPGAFAGRSPRATASPDLFVTSPYERGTSQTTYRVLVEAPGHDPQSVIVTLPFDPVNNLLFDLRGETGTLEVVVEDAQGDPLPCSVLVRGVDPDGAGPSPATANPTFNGVVSSTTGAGTSSADAFALGDGTNRVYLLDGTATLEVPPGFYQVVATRGLEYSLGRFPAAGSAQEYVRIAAGQTIRTVTGTEGIRLARLLDDGALPAPGGGAAFESPLRRLVCAELRAHTGASFDEPTPARDRLLQLLAAGVEVVVNTEHDTLRDLSGTLAGLDQETTQALSTKLRVQGGVELTPLLPVNVPGVAVFPNTVGSLSGWPVPTQDARRRNGAPADEFRNPAILIDTLKAQGASLVQLNLPRAPIAAAPLPPIGPGFFTNGKATFPQRNTGNAALLSGGYATPLRSSSTAATTNDGGLDDLNAARAPSTSRYNSFDLLEVYAGNQTLYDVTRTDSYALTSAGYVRTVTASDDLTRDHGVPRTFVRAAGDASADLSTLDLQAFNQTLLPSLVQATPGTTVPSLAQFFPATRRSGAGADAMEVVCSSGPLVYLEVDADEDGTFEGQPGDLVQDDGDLSVNVRLTVLAAPWVPVNSAKLIVNGGTPTLSGVSAAPATGFGFQEVAAVTSQLFTPSGADVAYSTQPSDVVRVRAVFTVSLRNPPAFTPPSGSAGDHWIVGEARGTPATGSLFKELLPGLSGDALGFTNPIFIDVNGDGDFDPPGVP